MMSWGIRIGCRLATAALGCALVTPPFAAAPEPLPLLIELDEVTVTAMKSLPLETYVAYPEFDTVAISPDGTRLAMSWTEGSYARLITVTEFPSMKRLHQQQLQLHMGATDLRWAGNRWLVVQPDYPLRGYLRIREPVGSLFVIDVDRHALRTINDAPLAQAALYQPSLLGDPLAQQLREQQAREHNARGAARAGRKAERDALGPVRLVQARTGTPEQLLFQTTLSTNRSGNSTDGYGAFVLDLPQFRQSRTAMLPLPGGQFVTGPDSRVALVTGSNSQNQQLVYYLPPQSREDGGDWQLLLSSGSGERGLRPIAWSGRDEEYYALDGRQPTRAVALWNATDNTQRLLYRHPDLDIDDFALDPAGRPWVFIGMGIEPVYWYPDPAHPLAQLHRRLRERTPGELVEVLNTSDDLSIAVVRVSSGRRPPVLLVVDVKSGATLTGMHSYTRLRTTRLAIVEPIELRARDGLPIQGFLTTPTDTDGNPLSGRPLVVVAHSGPDGKPGGGPGYEYERQLLASRGYAVLQVSPRGSTGRGAAFERAGDGKWGREVQLDFADAVQWALRDGVAAPGRVCFYGERFGAYTALMAAALEPDLFQCVVGIAGIYDLPALLGEGSSAIPPVLQQALGSDMQALKASSPVSHAAAIKAKVLLVQQQNYPEVPGEQTTRMRKALGDAGNRPRSQVIGQSGDGYFLTEERAGVYEQILRFVEQNIGN